MTKNSSTALQRNVARKTVLTATIIAIVLLFAGVFLVSHRLDKYLTKERILVLEKLLGIFLAALAVQLIINGLADLHIITVSVH